MELDVDIGKSPEVTELEELLETIEGGTFELDFNSPANQLVEDFTEELNGGFENRAPDWAQAVARKMVHMADNPRMYSVEPYVYDRIERGIEEQDKDPESPWNPNREEPWSLVWETRNLLRREHDSDILQELESALFETFRQFNLKSEIRWRDLVKIRERRKDLKYELRLDSDGPLRRSEYSSYTVPPLEEIAGELEPSNSSSFESAVERLRSGNYTSAFRMNAEVSHEDLARTIWEEGIAADGVSEENALSAALTYFEFPVTNEVRDVYRSGIVDVSFKSPGALILSLNFENRFLNAYVSNGGARIDNQLAVIDSYSDVTVQEDNRVSIEYSVPGIGEKSVTSEVYHESRHRAGYRVPVYVLEEGGEVHAELFENYADTSKID